MKLLFGSGAFLMERDASETEGWADGALLESKTDAGSACTSFAELAWDADTDELDTLVPEGEDELLESVGLTSEAQIFFQKRVLDAGGPSLEGILAEEDLLDIFWKIKMNDKDYEGQSDNTGCGRRVV